jgi:hypothetical protein
MAKAENGTLIMTTPRKPDAVSAGVDHLKWSAKNRIASGG